VQARLAVTAVLNLIRLCGFVQVIGIHSKEYRGEVMAYIILTVGTPVITAEIRLWKSRDWQMLLLPKRLK